MKLKKIVKHIDNFVQVKLYQYVNNEDLCLWSGSILDLQVAADTNKTREEYLKQCKEDGNAEDYLTVISVTPFLNYHLDTSIDNEAIGVYFETNEKGISIPYLSIYIKEKK